MAVSLSVEAGTRRPLAAVAWVAYMALVGWVWLGITGTSLVLISSTPVLRNAWGYKADLVLDMYTTRRVWMGQRLVVVRASGELIWIFRDEVPEERWRCLRRTLVVHRVSGLS